MTILHVEFTILNELNAACGLAELAVTCSQS